MLKGFLDVSLEEHMEIQRCMVMQGEGENRDRERAFFAEESGDEVRRLFKVAATTST